MFWLDERVRDQHFSFIAPPYRFRFVHDLLVAYVEISTLEENFASVQQDLVLLMRGFFVPSAYALETGNDLAYEELLKVTGEGEDVDDQITNLIEEFSDRAYYHYEELLCEDICMVLNQHRLSHFQSYTASMFDPFDISHELHFRPVTEVW